MARREPDLGRRGDPLATYQRRRLVAVVTLVIAVIVLGLALKDGGGGPVADPPLSADEVITREREQRPVRFTVSVSGDLLIHSPVYERAAQLAEGDGYDFTPMFRRIRPFVRGADLALCHVEVPMTPAPPASFPIFNTPLQLAQAIDRTGWEACDTASNHTLDQGQRGIDQTLRALNRAGVEHTGSYASRADSREILIVGVEGVRVAYIAYTTDTNGIPLPNPWSLNVAERPADVIDDARRAREQGADAVLVNMHWGIDITPEYVTEESDDQRAFARRLVRADEITAVVGQGPHVVQPIKRFQGKFVLFSEGNLISNQGADMGLAAESQDGIIGLLDFVVDGEGARVERVRYVPVWTSKPDFTVLPIGRALEGDDGNASELRSSYRRTVGIVGSGRRIEPEPAELP